jgi:menaquinone-9 beta-reductase
VWIDRDVIRAGYGWSFPAGDEVRVGVGSFDPRDHVKQPTVELAGRLGRAPEGYQGNWIPHRLRAATENGIFFAGDSAGHCIPLTAEGIRTALYFGIACGRELRAVLAGCQDRRAALGRYHAFSEAHRRRFEIMRRWQDAVPRLHPRAVRALSRALARPRASDWSFGHYWEIAPAQYALPAPPPARSRRAAQAIAA